MAFVDQHHSIHPLFLLIAITFLSTTSSMMVMTTLPVFLTEYLHLSYMQIGQIEGFAAVASFASKLGSGILLDRTKSRKRMLLLGTAASVLAKGLFLLATGFVSLFLCRILDRVAKGLRSCPSDAFIADLEKEERRSLYYGLKYTMLMAGGVLGGYCSYLLLKIIGIRFHIIFACSMVPALLAYLLTLKLEDKLPAPTPKKPQQKVGMQSFSLAYWHLLGIAFLLMFGRFSESFIMIKARSLGFAVENLPLLSAMYGTCAAISALSFGLYSIKKNKTVIFKTSLLLQVCALSIFLCAYNKPMVVLGGIFAGIHIGMAQGTLMAILTDYTTPQNRGTALSFYYGVAGIGLFFSNLLAGKLNDWSHSTSGAFCGGILACSLAWYLCRYLRHPDIALITRKF